MTNEEFRGLKQRDKVVTTKELRVGAHIHDAISFSYHDLDLVKAKDNYTKVISLDDRSFNSTIYLAVPIDVLSSSSLLALMKKDSVFVEIRNQNNLYNRIIKGVK